MLILTLSAIQTIELHRKKRAVFLFSLEKKKNLKFISRLKMITLSSEFHCYFIPSLIGKRKSEEGIEQ